MEYYLVINEWNYPTESGREVIGDFDSPQEAEKVSEEQSLKELDNFLSNTGGDIYREACGRVCNAYMDCEGYVLHSSPNETEDFFFRSVIIKREV